MTFVAVKHNNRMKVFLVALVATVARMGAQTQAQLDTNGNGFIEKEEMTMLPKGQAGDMAWLAVVNLGDSNKDGKLSVSELTSYNMKMKEQSQGQEQEQGRLSNPDTNMDGFISKDEMDEMVAILDEMGAYKVTNNCWQAILKKADKDGDGKIGMQEFVMIGDVPEACNKAEDLAQGGPPPSPDEYSDDFVDAYSDDFVDAYNDGFIDANNDGFITKDEMGTVLGAHHSFRTEIAVPISKIAVPISEFLSDPISELLSDNCWKEMLEIFDKDRDGRMSMREFHGPWSVPESCQGGPSAWQTKTPPTNENTCGTDDCWNTMLKIADKDGDGKMDATEFQDVAVGFKCLVKSLLLHFLDDTF